MRPSPLLPRVHFFVCANRREPDSPLGPGCSAAGEELVSTLKRLVIQSGQAQSVWVTETRCLGVCPSKGATVAIYPRSTIVSEVLATDAAALFENAT